MVFAFRGGMRRKGVGRNWSLQGKIPKFRNKPLEAAVSREAIRLTDASAAATETRIETRMSNRDSDGDSDKARVPTMSRRCRRSGTEP